MTSKWEKSLQNLFVGIGIFFLIFTTLFVSVEMGYRFFVKVQPSISAFETENSLNIPRPYVMTVADPNAGGINTLGYKGPLPPIPKPDDEYHIAILGGSSVFGSNPEDESLDNNSLPWHLEQVLQKEHGSKIKVFNFGITASIARQDLVRLYQDVVHFNPDLVIYFGGGDDLLQKDPRPGYPSRFLFYEINPLWVSASDYPLIQITLYGSLFLRHFLHKYFDNYFLKEGRTNTFAHPDMPQSSSHKNSYAHSLIYMRKISKVYNANFISISQPVKSLYFSDDNQKSATKNWFIGVENEFKNHDPKLVHISLSNFFKSSPESIWKDELHVIDSANRKLAQKLSQIVKKYNSKEIERLRRD